MNPEILDQTDFLNYSIVLCDILKKYSRCAFSWMIRHRDLIVCTVKTFSNCRRQKT